MKNTIPFRIFTFLLASALFISCSKEKRVIEKQQANASSKINTGIAGSSSGKFAPGYYGSVAGNLFPVPAKASIVAFNSDFVSEEVIAATDGTFRIDNLPPDGYHLRINYVPLNAGIYSTTYVWKIEVTSGAVTNLGDILLP